MAEAEALEPFCKGFPPPIFCDQAIIERCQPMKPDSPHLTLHVTFKPPALVRVVWFNGAASAANLGLGQGTTGWCAMWRSLHERAPASAGERRRGAVGRASRGFRAVRLARMMQA